MTPSTKLDFDDLLDLDQLLNPDLPIVTVPVAPWGQPATLVLLLPVEASSLVAALWLWPDGSVRDPKIGSA